MEKIIDWLVDFERTAADFYINAADYFSHDAGLAYLANQLAEDELWHVEVMKRVAACNINHVALNTPQTSLVKVDVESKRRIKTLLSDCMKKFDSGEATKREFLEHIIEAEYSEWNTYLLYAVNSSKDLSKEFENLPVKMQQHKGRIKEYILSLGDSKEAAGLIEKIGRLPDLWADRFLLAVDDENIIVDMLKAILESKGVVDCAYNGKEALKKFSARYYDITITDIDMPVMGGIEFFNRVKETDIDANKRFLFFTGLVTPQHAAFFRDNNVKYLTKPASIEEIISKIDGLLKSSLKPISTTP